MNHYWIRFLPRFIQAKLEGRQNLQKIVSNTGWLFADRILRIIGELGVGVWIARYLGPEQFGLLSYAIAFVALFSAIATLGLDRIVIREIVNDPHCKNETLGTTFFLKLFGGVLTLILAVGTIFLVRPNDPLSHRLVAIIAAGMIFNAFDAIDFWFQSQVQSQYTVIAKDVAFLLITLSKIALIQTEAPLIAFAWVGMIEIALGSVGLIVAYKINGDSLRKWNFSFQRAKELLKDSLPLILSGIAVMIYMRIDQIMLGQMTNDEVVGLYSAAVRLSEAWYFVPVTIASSVFPAVLESKKKSKELYYKRLQNLFLLMAALSYVIAVPATFFARSLMVSLYGNSYAEAGKLLAIHIWSGLFVSLGVARNLWLTAENLLFFSFTTTAMGAFVNVVLNYFLIPEFQALGATIATIISYALAAWLACFFNSKTKHLALLMSKSIILMR